MKNSIWLLIYGLTLVPCTAWAQKDSEHGLSAQDLRTVTSTDLKVCGAKVPTVPPTNARAFPIDRVEKTLNGVWRGKVWGEYDKKFLDKEGFLNVDYYMIVDVKRHEALVFEQYGPTRAVAHAKAEGPVWSYVMCGEEGYLPHHAAQVHEFQKVSDNVEDAREILRTSTGLAFEDKSELVLSEIWRKLVDTKYFDTARAPAYAGALFQPFEIEPVDEKNKSVFRMKLQAEYRGAGATAAKFQSGVPIHGVEQGQFLGVATDSGDFLVSSVGNGAEFNKQATDGGLIDMAFDKVIIGPLVK
jgi:hypothetical protein